MSERLRPRDEPERTQRCPYCHDALTDADAEATLRCESCGTDHHATCISELGRCTVLGCERPLLAVTLDLDPAHQSPQTRLLRRRIRSRVKGFVRDNAHRAASHGQMDPRDRGPDPHDPDSTRTPSVNEAGREMARMLVPLVIVPLVVIILGGLAYLLFELL